MADYLKLPEVARRLDVSEKTARRLVKSGGLPAVFIGGAYRVSEEDLTEYLESARVEPGKAPAPSPLEPSFNDVLNEGRREYDFQAARNGLDSFCEHWQRRLAARDLSRQAFDDLGVTVETWVPVLTQALAAEWNELHAAGKDWDQSVVWPAVERFLRLGEDLAQAEHEMFGKDMEAEKRRGSFEVLQGMRSTA